MITINNTYRFYSDCTMSLDVTGRVIDIIKGNEDIYVVSVGLKIIRIGANHPRLVVTPVA